MKVFWAINLYSRVRDAVCQADQVLREARFQVDVGFFTTGGQAVEEFQPHQLVYVMPNTGPQQGVVDAFQATARHVADLDYDLVVCAHADSLWTDFEGANRLIEKFEDASIVSAGTDGGDPNGYFGNSASTDGEDPNDNSVPWGIYLDLVVMRKAPFVRLFTNASPIGSDWVETHFAGILKEEGGFYVFPSSAAHQHQKDLKRLNNVMDVHGSDILLYHGLDRKLAEVGR